MRRLLLLLSFCPFIGQAFSQVTTGYHRVNQVVLRAPLSTTAQVAPNAKITVFSTATGLAATIYSDPLLQNPIVGSVVTTDSKGNYDYYIPIDYCVNESISAPGQGEKTVTNVCQLGSADDPTARAAASAAQSTANSAQTAANTAQTTANSAQTTANAAQTTANAALPANGLTSSATGNLTGAGKFSAGDDITKNSPYIDPRAFGAKEDCTTDDSAALQAAIDYGASSNSRVLISGCLAHASQINLPTLNTACNWWIEGTGPSAQIKATAPMTYQFYRGAGTGTGNTTCGQITGFSNIILNSAQQATSAIYIYEQHDLKLFNVLVLDALGNDTGTPSTSTGEVQIGTGSGATSGAKVINLKIDNSATIYGSNGIAYSGTAPGYGLWVGGNFPDSEFYGVLTAHNSEAGIYNAPGNNSFIRPHAWGYATGGTNPVSWPKWSIYLDTHSYGASVVGLEADTPSRAAVYVDAGNLNIDNTSYTCAGASGTCTAALGNVYIVEAGSSAVNFSVLGYTATGAGISPSGSPIYWSGGTVDTGTTYCGSLWGKCQFGARNGLHLAANPTTLDYQQTTGWARFNDVITLLPASNATSGGNNFPGDFENTANIWNPNTSASVAVKWSLKRFSTTNTGAGVPTFDQLIWAAPYAQSWFGNGPRQFGIGDLSTATSSNNYPPPDFIMQGACWNGTTSKSESFYWRTTYGTGANPTETFNLFNTANCSGTKSVSALFAWTVSSLSAGSISATSTVSTGSNILYRCTTAGTLPVGALTTVTSNCGASADTGLRVQ